MSEIRDQSNTDYGQFLWILQPGQGYPGGESVKSVLSIWAV
jgi:hypothetical protein